MLEVLLTKLSFVSPGSPSGVRGSRGIGVKLTKARQSFLSRMTQNVVENV